MEFLPGTRIKPARVFCIGSNYSDHVREMGALLAGDACVIFMKPPESLVPPGTPLVIPSGEVHHEVELVLLVERTAGAGPRVSHVTLGLDLTRRDEQHRLKQQGRPWELCKSFEQSAPVGTFVPVSAELNPDTVELECRVNGVLRQKGNTRDMIRPCARLLGEIGETWDLRTGDTVFTGTPSGIGPIVPGDEVAIASPQLGVFAWRVTAVRRGDSSTRHR